MEVLAGTMVVSFSLTPVAAGLDSQPMIMAITLNVDNRITSDWEVESFFILDLVNNDILIGKSL